MISGQQLPKVDKTKEGSIVDPLVRVEIFGVRPDTTRQETSYVENNGETGQCWGEWEEHDCYFPNILPFIQYSPCHHHPAPISIGGSVEQDKASGLCHLQSESWLLNYKVQ